ncbi:MAG: nitrilase-related carbon-nitrogen hydrolase [Fimbriimonadales bacterium]
MESGKDSGSGNLVAIEPWMTPRDYSSERAFQYKLGSYFEAAKRKGFLRSNTVVVLPEYLGTWLVVVDEKREVYSRGSKEEAMRDLALSNLPAAIWQAVRSSSPDRMLYAVLSFKSDTVAGIYDRTLSRLAQDYGVTVVGGSVVLQSPSIRAGHLVAGQGDLYNVTPVYKPTGEAYSSLVVKCFPTKDEKPFLAEGRVEDLPVFDTPAGRIGVLICADSWFPKCHAAMLQKGAQVVVSPTFGPERKVLDGIWKGYSGWPNPPDVDGDPGRITEREALHRYGLGGRLAASGIPAGMTSCLSGRLWDMHLDSLCIFVAEGKEQSTPEVEGATIANLWLTRPRPSP